jgi:hypothetical protein
MHLLQDVLNTHGSIALRAVEAVPVGLADVTFVNRRIRLTRGLSPTRFIDAFTHELVHLQRGPAFVDEVEAEEVFVEQTAQTLLYGPARQLALVQGGVR